MPVLDSDQFLELLLQQEVVTEELGKVEAQEQVEVRAVVAADDIPVELQYSPVVLVTHLLLLLVKAMLVLQD
jgi:hypothetical protein